MGNMDNINIGSALGLSVLGICIVFIVLILLMVIIVIMSKVISMVNKKSDTPEAIEFAAASAPPAKGSCGDLTLVKVSERDAAMIMAIVANQLKTPLNELRFISIKEAE